MTVKDIFTEIYRDGTWRELAPGCESHSGAGSTLAATENVRAWLPLLLERLHAKVLLDAPCGDCNWMRHVDLPTAYIGVDVVEELIEKNREEYALPGIRFRCLDLLTDELPRADVILCRDCLVHFSYQDVCRAVANFKKSGSEWLVATTYTKRTGNRLVQTGKWSPYCMTLPPFSFPEPVEILNEECRELWPHFSDKCLGLWKIESLP